MESTLQLSNIDLISTYAFKQEKTNSIPSTAAIQNEILGPALSDAQVHTFSLVTLFSYIDIYLVSFISFLSK